MQLAKKYDTEIISADSRQVYTELNIGVARPAIADLETIKHHCIGHISINNAYNTGDFVRDCNENLKTIFLKKNVAIICGGTGLYIKALLYGLDYFPDVDENVRSELNLIFKNEGIDILQKMLKEKDEVYYNIVDLQNPHRLIRALEVCNSSNKPYSYFLNRKKQHFPYSFENYVLNIPKEKLHHNIEVRAEKMIEQGLENEVKTLLPYKHLQALQTVGYKEIFDYLENKLTLSSAIELIKIHTKQYAKRQLTWLRKQENTIWIENTKEIM
jgi:tRNA dimethylallyltransferase